MSWTCLRCGAEFERLAPHCPKDAGRLIKSTEIRTGATLAGRYRLDGVIGGGAHALVYRGRHMDAARDVAVKVLRAANVQKPLMRERFLRESRAANRIRHRNVVDVTDVGTTEDGAPFLVMELIEGSPLSARLGDVWAQARVGWLGAEIAEALAAGHALGVVHRDLTPDNVLLVDDERLKVIDFGLAKLDGERRLTASSVMVGTPRYMAPEQIRGEPVGDRTDVYALACVLFEALSGSPLFSGSGPEVMAAHVTRAAPSLPDSVDAPLRELVAAGLSKRPSERPSAAAIVEMLSGQPVPQVAGGSGPTEGERLHERRALVVRLLDHIHPDGQLPETITTGLRSVRRALRTLRASGAVGGSAEERAGLEARIRAGVPGPIGNLDVPAARALAELGRLAERWLVLEELRPRAADDAPPSLADSELILDAIEAYIEAHPEGASLLPRRS